jgi:hypothetical protein
MPDVCDPALLLLPRTANDGGVKPYLSLFDGLSGRAVFGPHFYAPPNIRMRTGSRCIRHSWGPESEALLTLDGSNKA